MKRSLLLIAFLAAATFTFGQNRSDEKPMRKIASGNGARQIEEDVREAMKEVRIEMNKIDFEISEEIEEAMREVREELNDIDLEFDHDFDHDIDIDIDEDFEEDMDIDIDIDNDNDFDFDFDFDNDLDIDIDIDIEDIVNSAIRASQIDEDEIERIVEKAVKESTRPVRVRVKP